MSDERPIRFYYGAGHEQFPPGELLRHVAAAEEAGFDGISCSDHVAPWWPDGQSGQAWVWLGAAAQATKHVPLGTAVTPVVHRYHPVIVAQAFMTLEAMFPGRAYLGVGSGESLNESPCGMDWPPVPEQIARMEEALEIIDALFDGGTVTHDGRYFRTKEARLYTRAERRPPIYVSAFGPEAARVAARLGDGLWTLGDPEQAPQVIEAYREARQALGREQGEIVLQAMFSWAEDDDAAFRGAEVWRGAGPPEYYTNDWHDPAAMIAHARETIPEDEFRAGGIISADPDVHVRKIRDVCELGATIVALNNVSGADPLGAIATYREHVLPKLRKVRAAV